MEPKAYFDPPSEREWTIAEMEEFFAGQDAKNTPDPTGIFVTSITPPQYGWPIAAYCSICKETTFLLSPWAKKPDEGDYFKMNEMCVSNDHHIVSTFWKKRP